MERLNPKGFRLGPARMTISGQGLAESELILRRIIPYIKTHRDNTRDIGAPAVASPPDEMYAI